MHTGISLTCTRKTCDQRRVVVLVVLVVLVNGGGRAAPGCRDELKIPGSGLLQMHAWVF